MCYRKSFVTGPTDQVQTGECPSCGMPVAAPIGITQGTCPYCGKTIKADPPAAPANPATPKPII